MKHWAYVLIPALLLLLALLSFGLTNDPRAIPSPLVGKTFPQIKGVDMEGNPVVLGKLTGKPLIINVWGSWCPACRIEHNALLRAANKHGRDVEFIGVNFKDELQNGKRWLKVLGNPYAWTMFDKSGRVGLELGVYGAPETFFVNQQGIIIHKEAGPVTDELIDEMVAKLKQVK